MKRKDIVDFEELAQIGKDWEAEWATMRDYNSLPPPALETSFLPEFVYKSEETQNTRTSLAAMDAHIEEKNTPRKKTHSPPRTVRCDAMLHSPPRQKIPEPGRKIRDNHAQRFLSLNKPRQNVAKINVEAISQAPSTSTTIICRNCLSYGISAPHDHSTIKCTKEQQIFCYKYSGGVRACLSPGESRTYLDSDKFSENVCAALKFYKQGTRFFVKLKIASREFEALLDSDSTKSILGNQGIELVAEFNQEIKPSEVKATLFPNGSKESDLAQVVLPSTLDVVQKCVEYKVVLNFKYQCVLFVCHSTMVGPCSVSCCVGRDEQANRQAD